MSVIAMTDTAYGWHEDGWHEEFDCDYGPAYHEAGHALVIVRLDLWKGGWRVVLPGPEDSKRLGLAGVVLPPGRKLYDPDPPPRTRRYLSRGDEEIDLALRHCAARNAIMSLAGCLAQFPRTRDWTRLHADHSKTDSRHALQEFNEFGFDPPMPWRTLNEAAIECVDRDWGALEAIAAALDSRRELSEDEVIQLIVSAPSYRNPHRERAPVWETEDPIEVVAEQLNCWRRDDWVEEDRIAAMNEAES